jgi:hypothetical protein
MAVSITVAELRKILASYPDDLPVFIEHESLEGPLEYAFLDLEAGDLEVKEIKVRAETFMALVL